MKIANVLACGIWLVASATVWAAEPPHDVTLDDYFSLAMVTQLAVSPDGQYAAYCEARWQQSTDDRKTELWVVATGADPQPRRLTFDRASSRLPQWSADGRTIYFLAERKREAEKKPPLDGKTQVWRIGLDGGEPQPVTQVEGGITGYGLAASADQLYYSVDASTTDEDAFSKLRKQFSALEYQQGKRTVSEVWRLDLKTWRAEKVTAEKRYVREFAVTADGKRVAMISAADDSVLKSEGESRVDVWEDGRVTTPPTDVYRAKAPSPHAWLESLAWSPDGQRFAFCAIFDAYPAEIVVGSKTSGQWQTELMPRPAEVHVRGYGSPLKWHPSGSVFFVAERGAKTFVVPSDPNVHASLPQSGLPDHVVYAFDTDAAGRLGVYVLGRPDQTARVVRFRIQAGRTAASPDDAQSADRHLEAAHHPARHLEGCGRRDGRRHPGTAARQQDGRNGCRWSSAFTAVRPPPSRRPSNSIRTTAACTSGPGLRGALPELSRLDRLRRQVRHRSDRQRKRHRSEGHRRRRAAPRERRHRRPGAIGVMGWSNGGYLTNCLITRKDLPLKLKAASSGAGILDTVMEWGINDEPAYPKVFKKGLPWETPDVYHKTSPTYGLGNVTTPTLIHVGGNDVRCPPGHSRMLYRALNEYVRVPTELVRLSRRTARPRQVHQSQGEDGMGPGVVPEVLEGK